MMIKFRKRDYLAIVIVCMLILMAIFSPVVTQHNPQFIEMSKKVALPSATHILGNDQLGRDIFARLVYATRFSLFLTLTITILELALGLSFGLFIGYVGGKVEKLFLWFANIISSFPSFLLSLATVGILGQGMLNMIIAIVFVEWFHYARLVIANVKKVKDEPYVLTAKIMGYSNFYILKRHILPFIYRPILVMALMNVGNIILMISGFSFLGIGVQPNVTEWGMMLHDARPYFRTNLGMMLYPGLMIFLTVIAFNILGEIFKGRSESYDKN